MLSHRIPVREAQHIGHCANTISRQNGVVLLISLMILVVLSLAGVALVRSVDTTNLVAGNLAFQKSATFSGEAGIEAAISRILVAEVAGPIELQQDHVGTTGWGYYASASINTQPASRRYANYQAYGDNPVTAAQWDDYWERAINPNPAAGPICKERVCTLATDAVGNTVSYTIQRLCEQTGDPYDDVTGCIPARDVLGHGNSLGSQNTTYAAKSQVFYRITSRVVGPRNSVSYVQAIVAK